MGRSPTFAVILLVALAAEEATQGYLLGLRPLWPLCDALGGKHASNSFSTRCYTRLCYWLGDCDHWASPMSWAHRLKPGDPKSKIVFWLGEPEKQEGEDLLWQCGKGDDEMCKAVILDGRLVAFER